MLLCVCGSTLLKNWRKGMSSRLDRSAVPIRRGRLHDAGPDHAAVPSADECIEMVWEMTMNAWAFMGHEDALPRLQRHVLRRGRGPHPRLVTLACPLSR